MKKIKYYVMVLLAVLVLVPSIPALAKGNVVEEITLTCEKTSVTLNENLEDVTVTVGHETYYVSDVDWIYKIGSGDWQDVDEPVAGNAEAHFGLRVSIETANDYELEKSTTHATWNGTAIDDYSITSYDSANFYIDLGTPTSAEEPEEPENPVKYTVTLDFNGGTNISNYPQEMEYDAGDTMEFAPITIYQLRPPKGKQFDAYEINGVRREGSFQIEITGDTTVKVLWKNAETKDYNYTHEDSGVSVTFNDSDLYDDEDGEDFLFSVDSIGMWTDALYAKYGFTEEEIANDKANLEETRKLVKKTTDKYGDLLDVFAFYLEDADENEYAEGPFTLSFKKPKTEKKYKKYLMVFLNEDLEATGETVEFTVDGENLTGDLPHFSTYALVGTNDPETGDHIAIYIILGLLSEVGIVSVRKLRKN